MLGDKSDGDLNKKSDDDGKLLPSEISVRCLIARMRYLNPTND